MIIVDSSIWIEHLAKYSAPMADLLDAGEVLMHPFVIGELACGTLKDRIEVLEYMGKLLEPVVAGDAEVLSFIEQRRLMGCGVGYIDIHLLASTLLTDSARLWTRDRRLRDAAAELDVAYTVNR